MSVYRQEMNADPRLVERLREQRERRKEQMAQLRESVQESQVLAAKVASVIQRQAERISELERDLELEKSYSKYLLARLEGTKPRSIIRQADDAPRDAA